MTGPTAPVRPLPRFPEPDTEPFWRATHDHKLLYQADAVTGEVVFFPRRGPAGRQLEWRESAGTGTIYTFTVIRQHGHAFFRARTPYIVAFVDLDEGFRMLTEIAADPETVHIGARVRVDWEDHDEVSVPVFRLVDGA
jgi:uncharacterized OB-fold protein